MERRHITATVVEPHANGWIVVRDDGVRAILSREVVAGVRHLRAGQQLQVDLDDGDPIRAWIGPRS